MIIFVHKLKKHIHYLKYKMKFTSLSLVIFDHIEQLHIAFEFVPTICSIFFGLFDTANDFPNILFIDLFLFDLIFISLDFNLIIDIQQIGSNDIMVSVHHNINDYGVACQNDDGHVELVSELIVFGAIVSVTFNKQCRN